jgi:hypothetical protein
MTDLLLEPPSIALTLPTPVSAPCVYCREPIAADSFVSWPGGKPLVSAGCPSCGRRVTLPAASLRRLTFDLRTAKS